jgi:hypothetical protein
VLVATTEVLTVFAIEVRARVNRVDVVAASSSRPFRNLFTIAVLVTASKELSGNPEWTPEYMQSDENGSQQEVTMNERQWELYRLSVVERWSDSPYKRAVSAAIEHKLMVLGQHTAAREEPKKDAGAANSRTRYIAA